MRRLNLGFLALAGAIAALWHALVGRSQPSSPSGCYAPSCPEPLLDFEPPVDQKVLEEPSPQKSRRRTEIKFHRDHDQGRMTLLGINCYVGSVNTDQEHSWMAATARRELSNEAEFAVEPEFEFGEDARQLSEPSSRAVRG